MLPPQEPGAAGVGWGLTAFGAKLSTAPRQAPIPPPPPPSAQANQHAYGAELVGQSINLCSSNHTKSKVIWLGHLVTAFSESTGQHTLVNADGKATHLTLGTGVRFKWPSGTPPQHAFNVTYSPTQSPHGVDAVGRKLRVFWPAMGRYYQGVVAAYSASDNKHRIDYPDADWHWMDLRYESVEWLAHEGTRVSVGCPTATANGSDPQERDHGGDSQAPAAQV